MLLIKFISVDHRGQTACACMQLLLIIHYSRVGLLCFCPREKHNLFCSSSGSRLAHLTNSSSYVFTFSANKADSDPTEMLDRGIVVNQNNHIFVLYLNHHPAPEKFSLSSVFDPKAEYIGTEPWKPKEALEEGEITDKADIFAYGLTLWEMMTLVMPHMEMLEDEDDDDDDTEEDEGEMQPRPLIYIFRDEELPYWSEYKTMFFALK